MSSFRMDEETAAMAVVWALSALITAGLAWALIGTAWGVATLIGWLLVIALYVKKDASHE